MNQEISAMQAGMITKLSIPGSKKMTLRALLIAALADGVSEITELFICNEVITFANVLRELGLMIQLDKSTRSCIIGGGGGKVPRPSGALFFNDEKTAAIFLLALCATSEGIYEFNACETLRTISFLPMLQALTRLGAKLSPHNAHALPLNIQGQGNLKGGEIEINADPEGTFISALLLVSPFSKQPALLKTDATVNQPYIDMTCEMMADFNVLVRRMHKGRYSVPVPQRYLARDYSVEPDLTIAANFFAIAAILGKQISIQAFSRATSKQNEVEYFHILEKMGCVITESEDGFILSGPEELKGVNVDMHNFSSTFMALAIIAPFAKTPTTLTNIRHVVPDTQDKISLMQAELKKLNCKVESGKDWLKIYPSVLKSAFVDAHNDPYMAMAFNMLRLVFPNLQIMNGEGIQKVCPNFFKLKESIII